VNYEEQDAGSVEQEGRPSAFTFAFGVLPFAFWLPLTARIYVL
jgi:ABC-type Na+ efflux pump permease subunit